MADQEPNRFGLSLWHQSLKEPKLDERGVMNSRPSEMDRGLMLNQNNNSQKILDSHLKLKEPKLDASQSAALKKAEIAQFKTIFDTKISGSVPNSVITENDGILKHTEIYALIKMIADEFEIKRGILASHLMAENDLLFAFKRGYLTTDEFGMDDFVGEYVAIVASVGKRAKNLDIKIIDENSKDPSKKIISVPKGKNSEETKENILKLISKKDDYMIPENQANRGEAKTKKGKVGFEFKDGVRACATYIKYKINIARSKNNLGKVGFATLLPEIRYQLTRLLVNPGSPEYLTGESKKKIGTIYWISQVKQGNFLNLFDYRNLSLAESYNNTRRRATIHTMRALHYSKDFYGEEP